MTTKMPHGACNCSQCKPIEPHRREGLRELVRVSEEAGAYEAAELHVIEDPVPREYGRARAGQSGRVPAADAPAWKVGDRVVLYGYQNSKAYEIAGIDGEQVWLRDPTGGENGTYYLADLTRPAPNRRRVTKQVWLCAEWNNEEGWYVSVVDPRKPGAVVVAGPVKVTFEVEE